MTDESFRVLENDIRKNGALVLWTGDGIFPGRASRLRGLLFSAGRHALKRRLEDFCGEARPKPRRAAGKGRK